MDLVRTYLVSESFGSVGLRNIVKSVKRRSSSNHLSAMKVFAKADSTSSHHNLFRFVQVILYEPPAFFLQRCATLLLDLHHLLIVLPQVSPTARLAGQPCSLPALFALDFPSLSIQSIHYHFPVHMSGHKLLPPNCSCPNQRSLMCTSAAPKRSRSFFPVGRIKRYE